ncbi:type I DNA topoisomerase [Angelakisella massiliensis]|uniref:type I DNA topoisomerase n=1 Tax=Angelakisella massiliensis TaxID=1871018 RepID=UPI0024B06EC8|nr:type I DNA topoisomerase [Angelakisella massiliensis]
MSKLVIVESPAKANTIKKYLGSGYEVMASMGHVRDLPKSKLGVDVENHFQPKYEPIKGKEDLIKKLKSAAKKSETVYLATDPDREGEAISWHLAEILGVDTNQPNRVTFNEITRTGVKNGMDHPRKLDMQLVDAQQARRVLDRIVGYKISPFLWKKIRPRLSAGRVQSVAVRMIVDREEEIRAFKPEEYWSIDAMLSRTEGKREEKKPFPAKYYGADGKKQEIKTQEQAEAILAEIKDTPFTVSNIKKGVRKKSPAPPFITSTLQQDASRRLSYQAKRTMKVAQELYEGVEIDGLGAVGLITYMRTDSLRISDEALAEADKYIRATYGEAYALSKPRVFKTKKNAQDAHEAIRPTMIELAPEKVKANLTTEQYKLYKLIWERFIASQMANALLDTVSVDISAGKHLFKASGFNIKFDGFTVLYTETTDSNEEGGGRLPTLTEEEQLAVNELKPNQHFTQPPPRYTEASLIKELEENGIGRPSTYATTLSTIQTRGYVEREQKALKPTALGEVTTKLMEEQFPKIVDAAFTADMESKLDQVEDGEVDWEKMMEDFYQDFDATLQQAEKNMDGTRMKVPDEETDVVCELCGRKMVIKHGRFGKFLACPGFPECRNTKKLVQETPGTCPVCGKRVLAKKSKAGRGYYGCEDNPKCGFMTWDTPLADKCPKCGSTLFRTTGKMKKVHCLKEGCGYEKGADEE